jgi:hypothetical protein
VKVKAALYGSGDETRKLENCSKNSRQLQNKALISGLCIHRIVRITYKNTADYAHVCTFMSLYKTAPPVNREKVSKFALLDRKLSPVLGFSCTRLHLPEDA